MRDSEGFYAGLGQPVVEPGGSAIAEVGADRVVNRVEHLAEHERETHDREGQDEIVGALHRAHQPTHGDGEQGRQHPSQHEDQPPQARQGHVRARQDGEELPLVASGQPLHGLRAQR